MTPLTLNVEYFHRLILLKGFVQPPVQSNLGWLEDVTMYGLGILRSSLMTDGAMSSTW
jgi:hypothetical protein